MKNLKYIFILLFALISIPNIHAESPAEILGKAATKLTNATGANCTFKISGNEINLGGTFKSSRNKFCLQTSASTTWYDGEKMWTANHSSKEITLVNPTTEELNEVNPFAYIQSYNSKYRIYLSKRKDSSRHLVLLNPRNSKDQIKAIEIAINKKTYLPERFIIRDKNDNRTTIYVNSLSLTSKNSSSDFVCPVKAMSDYELIDLR